MLGKRPRPLLRTSSKLQPMPGDPLNCIEKPKSPSPSSGAPRQIIGFNPVSNDRDVGGSPLSVLDPKALSSGIASKEKPARSPRSPRSGLEGLISSPRPWEKKSCEGIGLAIVAAMQGEELGSIGIRKESMGRLCQNVSFKCFPLASAAAPSPTHSQPIPIASKENRHAKASREGEHDAAFFRNHRAWRRSPAKNSCWDADSDEEMEVRESIFSTASPGSCCHDNSGHFLAMDFLNACFFCKRLLGPGKDIFMYRGDRAFCSAECRYQQIVIDERKERCSAAFKAGSNVFSLSSKHRNRVLATTTAAAA